MSGDKYIIANQQQTYFLTLTIIDWVLQRLHYIHQNPVRQMIVSNPEEYIFSSAIDYADGKGLVTITKL